MDPERRWRVDVGADSIVCRRPDEVEDRVSIGDLSGVDVVTTDEGPWRPDVWYELFDRAGGRLIAPQGCSGEERLLDVLFGLPGFEMKGMDSTDNARFEPLASAAVRIAPHLSGLRVLAPQHDALTLPRMHANPHLVAAGQPGAGRAGERLGL